MLIKIFLFIFLSSIHFSANAYVLLSAKTIVSPDGEGGVLEHIIESHILSSCDYPTDYIAARHKKKQKNDLTVPTATTEAKVFSATGNTKQMIRLKSSHAFTIHNITNSPITINLIVILCTHDGKFTRNEYSYQLAPQEIMKDSTTLYYNKQYFKPDDYEVYASTILTGDVSSSSIDINVVKIR